MKKLLLAAICLFALGPLAAAVAASPVTLAIGDGYFLGSVVPDGGNQAMEMLYVNTLIGLGLGEVTWLERPPVGPANDALVTRSGNTFADLPPATWGIKHDTSVQPEGGFTTPGWYYLLGKYGSDAYIWVVADLEETFFLPARVEASGGLSHYSFYEPVPDGGATFLLLGGALAGLAALRRRLGV